MDYSVKKVTIDDYDAIYELWNSTEQSRRALNPIDDSRDGIARYLKRNPDTCFAAVCYSSHYPSHISEKFCKLKEGTVYSNLSDVASDCFILYLLLS